VVEANKSKIKTSNTTELHRVGGEQLGDDGSTSIMEWTGAQISTIYTKGELNQQDRPWCLHGFCNTVRSEAHYHSIISAHIVYRYLVAKHNTNWPELKNLRQPVRIGDIVVLPVTGE
jgi:hypothetical protein